jgi:predicted kinase
VHLRSDIERKRMLGADEHHRLPEEAYAHALTKRVFAALREQAGLALAAGQSVVVDAVHHRPDERDAIAAVAARLGVRFAGLWLEASLETASKRVEARHGDASDATAAVVARQAARPMGPIAWTRIDASGDVGTVVTAALKAIGA